MATTIDEELHLYKIPHLINLIESTPLPQDCILASIDVSSLYTNIPHVEGRKYAVEALQNIATPDPLQPPPLIIGELIDFVLKNNVFEFDGEFYLQLQGTAMGTKMAPAYANVFMGKIEEILKQLGQGNIALWLRFIDDIFLIWTSTMELLLDYMSRINSTHHTIKFTHECDLKEITFLDVTLYKGQRFQESGILDVKTHIKPTNKQLYIHASSYHPKSTKLGVATGETKHYLRTNSNETTFKQNVNKLVSKLTGRGYSKKAILTQTQKVSFADRPAQLQRQIRENKQQLVFVTIVTTHIL